MILPNRNPVNHRKLPNSKWTAVHPVNREKHFLVLDWVRDEDGDPTDESWIYAPAPSSLEFFLVVDVQADGTEGSSGHYGR